MDKFEELFKAVKDQEAASVAKASELIQQAGKKFGKKQEVEVEEKKCNTLAWVIGITIGVVVVAAVCYALYRYFTPDYLEDFDEDFSDDFDDDFDDDYFDDEADV